MPLGIGLPIWARPHVYNPAVLPSSGWWRGSYSGSPWVGTASGGASGGFNLTEATNPPTTGTAVNGFTPATFNGTTQKLANSNTMSNFVTSTAWATWVMFKAAAAAADPGAGARYQSPHFWSDTSSGIGVGFSTAGIFVHQVDSTPVQKDVALACATGAWHVLFAWWDGSLLHLQLDNGTPTTVSCTSQWSNVATATFVAGTNYNASAFFQGDIMEIETKTNGFSGSEIPNIYSYLKARYPSAGLP